MKKWFIALFVVIIACLSVLFGLKYIKNRPVKVEDLKRLYPVTYSDVVFANSEKYSLDPYMVFALIKAESAYKKDAKSSQSAMGLMQITPKTAHWIAEKMGMKDFSEDKLFEPTINIEMGCWYLQNLRQEFGKKDELILAAYNAGRGNVSSWLQDGRYSDDGETLKDIPFSETKEYVKKIKQYEEKYKELYKQEFETKEVDNTK